MRIARGIVELGEAEIDQDRRLIGFQNDIAGLDITMHNGWIAAMQFLQDIYYRQEPGEHLMLATGTLALLIGLLFTHNSTRDTCAQKLQKILPFDQLHNKVEATIKFEGIVDIGQMLAANRQQDARLHQRLAAHSRRDIIQLFNSTKTIALAGIGASIDGPKAAAINQAADNVVPTDDCSRR